jgi:hypothetical protein
MEERKTIELLRTALAAIWTECEKDQPNIEHVQIIATEAIDATIMFAKAKVPSNDDGIDSWRRFFDQIKIVHNNLPQWKKDFLRKDSEQFKKNMEAVNWDD